MKNIKTLVVKTENKFEISFDSEDSEVDFDIFLNSGIDTIQIDEKIYQIDKRSVVAEGKTNKITNKLILYVKIQNGDWSFF